MSHCVPDFGLEFDDPYAAPLRHKDADLPADELFELLWRNGPVAHPVLDDRLRGRSLPEIPVAGPPLPAGMAAAEAEAAARQLFIEEDEMASWLHYQIGEDGDGGNELYGELLGSSMDAGRIPADQVTEAYTTQVDERPQPPPPEKLRRVLASVESAVVDSNETPGVAAPPGRGLLLGSRRAPAGIGEPCASEQGITSSSVASGERDARAHADERKRKAREDDDSGYQSEDAEFRSGDKRKSARRSASTRRARAAEVHNLSERRRRDRINEKMKALQELIPRCNKTDKASMLDEAIEYLKSLQLQVQMMSMGCSMGTVMFPGVQTYIPPMGMGMGMGMGIATGSEVGAAGLGHPMLQFGHVLPCRPIVGPTVRPQLAPRPLMPSVHPPSIAIADQSRVQASSRQDPASNPVSMLGPNMVRIPNVANRYHHYAGSHQLQNQAKADPGTSKRAGIAEKPNSG